MRRLLSILFFIGTTSLASPAQEEPLENRLYSVPDIQGRATLLVKPVLSGEAMMANDGVTLVLKVYVDTDGNVIDAKCALACPAAVARPAEAAAMESKFRPLIVNGRAVKYTGTLHYTIAIEKVNWYRFGTALYSTYIFDNISLGPVAAILTSEFADEKIKLQELDNGSELSTRWKAIESVRDSIKGKLNDSDVWWFTLGMAVREVTAPFQSDRKLNRAELQRAISNLSKFVASVPADVPKELIEDLKALSEYKVDPEMPVRDLQQSIAKLTIRIDPDRKRTPHRPQ